MLSRARAGYVQEVIAMPVSMSIACVWTANLTLLWSLRTHALTYTFTLCLVFTLTIRCIYIYISCIFQCIVCCRKWMNYWRPNRALLDWASGAVQYSTAHPVHQSSVPRDLSVPSAHWYSTEVPHLSSRGNSAHDNTWHGGSKYTFRM
jgi:hypothetical protein